MIHRLKTFLEAKGYTLNEVADCYNATSPNGNKALINLRWKTKPVWGKIAKRWEWSMPLLRWEAYQRMGVAYSFIFEKATGKIYVASIKELTPQARIYQGEDLDKGGTVFLPVLAYKTVATV